MSQSRGRMRPFREALTILLANLLITLLLMAARADPRQSATRVLPAPSPSPAPSATPVRIRVHVTGAVRRPGVVAMGASARAEDAVAAAGGFAPEADPAPVNLAAPLIDGMQLTIPARGEEVVAPLIPAAVATGGMSGRAPPSGRSGLSSVGAGSASAPSGGAIDLNRATAAELESLPGIGPALASRIVAHREKQGLFGSPTDLLAVSGIGEKTLARFVDRLVVR